MKTYEKRVKSTALRVPSAPASVLAKSSLLVVDNAHLYLEVGVVIKQTYETVFTMQ